MKQIKINSIVIDNIQYEKRKIAVKVADAINAIEGQAASDNAKKLSNQWANGEITGGQMKSMLISRYLKSKKVE